MSHKKGKSLVRQVDEAIRRINRFGESKHKAKSDGTADKYIYSYSTAKVYKQQACQFVRWCKAGHKEVKTLADCRKYADDWLTSMENRGLSPYTLKTARSALLKVYGESGKSFRQISTIRALPPTKLDDITRSRKETKSDKHFSEEKHQDFVRFCRAVGCRRRELEQLTIDNICAPPDDVGALGVLVTNGKGGKARVIPVLSGEEEFITEYLADGRRLDYSGADIHSYRADYATELYKSLARPLESIPYDRVNKGSGRAYQSEVYHCRGSRKGLALDKRALAIVSKALGHNRISVVGEHYLRV